MYITSGKQPQRHGLTLIEVMASLALLGTLLVGLLVAHSRHARQIRRAILRIEANQAADGLIADWLHSPAGVPRSQSDVVAENAHLNWKTEVISTQHRHGLGVDVVRVTLFGLSADEPLTFVDLVVPPSRQGDP